VAALILNRGHKIGVSSKITVLEERIEDVRQSTNER
jgi:hypothetical protein